MPRKPHSNSNLKGLSADLQGEIIARLKVKGGSYKAVVKWLQDECDLETSEGALSTFWHWWHLQERFKLAEQKALDHQAWLKQHAQHLSAEEVLEAGNIVFMSEASAGGDPKTFEAMAKLHLRNRKDKAHERYTTQKLGLDERRIAVLEAKAAKLDQAVALDGEQLTPDQYKERMKKILA